MKRYLLISAAVLAVFGAWRIYANNQTAVKQVQAILSADDTGTDVTAQTAALNRFVQGHMGSSVRYELTGSYNRAVAAAQAAAQPEVNDALYQQANSACASRDAKTQAKCIQDYISAHPPAETKPAVMPDRNTYKRQLTAPLWTADLAGASLLAAFTLAVLVGWFWLVEKLAARH